MTDRWLDDVEMQAWVAFLDTSNLLLRRVDRQLREDAGLTQPQYELLTRLAQAPEQRMRMAELADALVASRSGLTYQVAQLEKSGLVRREAYAGDDRGVLAVLTDEGDAVLRRTAPGHVRVVRENLVDVLDREQLVSLADMLGRTRAHLRGLGPEGAG
ncbi:DNA-binding MarR family transcriptional regulator [Motilibacter rhizosphaerae]|uniref:DNA-binding MarR family transcriptional regulator n=1 Tax=Motilibacter rhizosphaerae TaxID=598652 RepID=A0A4Q7N7A0_9ACTN|nr:MarR family transcriptional regulator [Motilibacter rhizosphaerae]RZS77558.1 DNA-binding MarR family transcriptional regulator [Motilibacter rhizosphaerae]